MNDNNKTNNDLDHKHQMNTNSKEFRLGSDMDISDIDNNVSELQIISTKNDLDIGLFQEQNKANQMSIFDNKRVEHDNKKSMNKNSNQISKGYLLEYRLKRLIFAMGYFPKIGVTLKTSQDEQADTITDLDVYGFYIHKNFVSKTIWADCKSGQAKSLDRISWITGVKYMTQIDDVIFIKKGVRSSTRQFARRSGVQVLDLETIEKLERNFGIELNDWRGSWNPNTQLNQLVTFQKINIPNNVTFKKIGNYISCGYWTFDNYTQIKKTITALKQLSEIEQYPLQNEQIKSIHWTIFELINLFVLATLNISKELYYFSDNDKKETIIDGLVSGEISAKKRSEIVAATYKTAYSIIQKQFPEFVAQLQFPNIGLNPPKYFEAFNDLILRITNDPLNYFDILRFLDFVFMEYDLQNKKPDDKVLKDLFPNYDNLIISAKTIIHFVCGITGMRRDLFQLIN